MKTCLLAFIGFFLGLSVPTFAQRGIITKPAVGNNILDPNQDGYVSATTAGFSNDGYYVDEFEIPMFGIPIVGDGDVLNDNQAGPNCGITDLTVDSQGFSVYGVLDNNGNLIFRFRIGDDNPSVEAYTILIDTDGKIGSDDLNATPDNPGFEIDITLIKNSSKGVYIYNIDGIESCPTPLFNYSFNSNFQISVADVVSCSDPDYFYDYFVPFSDIVSSFGVSDLTEMRFVAVTNISATCAMSGKISDVGGVDDTQYGGCNTCAFLDLVNNQCPTAIADLCPTCQGFLTGVTPKPTINAPLKVGEFTATGTTVANAEIFLDVFDIADVLKDQKTVFADAAGDWLVNLSVALALGDSVTAKARAPGLCSSGSLSSGASFTIVVQNQAPVLNAGSTTLIYNENDPPLRINGALTITDPDDIEIESAEVAISGNYISGEDILTFTSVPGVSGTFNVGSGTISFSGTATLTQYQTLLRSVHYSNTSEAPNTSQRSITMIVYDGLDNSNVITRFINVVTVNDAPVAVNDGGTTNEDTFVVLNVATNDTDVDGTIDPATVDLDPGTGGIQNVFTNAQGSWSVNGSGDVTYTPATNFNGVAARTYTIQDNLGATSNQATITITVNSVNDAPIANDDSDVTLEDTPITLINITANDTDVDGTINPATVDLDPLTIGIQNTFSDAQGDWSVNASGDVTYSPALNFNGLVTRNYTVNDNQGATSSIATISITITPVNDAPVAVNDSGVTNEDTPVVILDITSNDTDVDGTVDAATVDLDLLTAGIQNSITNAFGNWSVNASGDLTFTPALNFNGIATKQYRVNDNQGATSNAATVTITVNSVNDLPVANDDSGTTYLSTAATINVTNNDTDVDGTINTATVDLDPGTAGIQSVFATADGNWSVDASGNVTFTPALAFSGITSIPYTVNDNSGGTSLPANISFTVSGTDPGGSPPTANADAGTTDENIAIFIDVLANDNPGTNAINQTSVDLNLSSGGIQNSVTDANGTWSVDGSGNLTFTPTLNLNGVVMRQYTVQDVVGRTSNAATITITINSINNLPVAFDDSGTTTEETPITLLDITSNDTDVDGTIDAATIDLDVLSIGIQNTISDAQGSWSVNGVGDLTYVPALNFSGNASRSYTVNDNEGATSLPANINISVTAVNDATTAVDDNATTNEDTPISFSIVANDFDVDGTVDVSSVDLDLLTAGIQNTITNSFGSWTVSALGELSYSPLLNFNGVALVQYRIKDNDGATSASANVSITVNPVNDAPVAIDINGITGITNEDISVTLVDITSNYMDIDGAVDPAAVDLDISTPGIQNTVTSAEGTWTVNALGDLLFTPALNINGVAIITYSVNDDLGATSDPSTIMISINPVNDPPFLVDLAFTTIEEIPLNGSIFDLNDIDIEGTALVVDTSPASFPSNGEIVINEDGTFTYTPGPLFSGQDIALVSICDAGIPLPSACATKTLTITVTPVNHSPQTFINGQPGGVLKASTNEDESIVVCFESVDPDGDDVTLSSVVNIQGGGALTLYDNIEFCFEFVPEKDFNGAVIWEITVCDDGVPSLCGVVSIEIDVLPVNDPPTAVRDSINVLRNVNSFGNVLDNDFDIEGDLFTATGTPVAMPAHGTAILNSDGNFSYQSERTFRGIDSLVYEVCDNAIPSACSEGTLVIVVGDLPLRPYEGFTPNGDGNNDYWRIDGIDFYTNNKVRVFDRYNNLVFEMFGYNNENKIWRGEANHGMNSGGLPEETYFYNIDLGDGSAPVSGFIVLKRK